MSENDNSLAFEDLPKYVNIDALAEFFSVKVSTVRAWLKQGRIPPKGYIKINSTYRFHIPDVIAAMKEEAEKRGGNFEQKNKIVLGGDDETYY
jgi:predicted site-specific integrase-resolvase